MNQKKKQYRLRWYYDYVNKAPYYGVWSIADPSRPAWARAYEGIARAIIQGKDMEGKIVNLIDIPGCDFQNFQWIAETKYRGSFDANKKLPCKIVGLMIQHRYGQAQAYIDGTIINNKTVYDCNYLTYGK
jgi:hypothetical protein